MAMVKTAVATIAGDEVVCFDEEYQQPRKISKSQLGAAVCKQTPTSRSGVHMQLAAVFSCVTFFIHNLAQYSVLGVRSREKI